MTIDEAQRVLTEAADDLTARLHARGYPKAAVEIWISRGVARGATVFINDRPKDLPYIYSQPTASVLIEKARAAIDALPDASRLGDWFDMAYDAPAEAVAAQ